MLMYLWIQLAILIGVGFQDILCMETCDLVNCFSDAMKNFSCES